MPNLLDQEALCDHMLDFLDPEALCGNMSDFWDLESLCSNTLNLLDLPPEIRYIIYRLHFESFTFCYDGHSNVAPRPRRKNNRRPNKLSLLRTCKLIHAETKDLWMNFARFKFRTARELLDKLEPLPTMTRQNIKHVMVSSERIQLGFGTATYDLLEILEHLEGFCPTTLTVDAYVPRSEVKKAKNFLFYSFFGPLIRSRIYLSTLYIVVGSHVMGNECDRPQPITWSEELRSQYTYSTNTNVKMFRAYRSGKPIDAHHPNKRESLTIAQGYEAGTQLHRLPDGLRDDLTSETGGDRAILIVANRCGKMINVLERNSRTHSGAKWPSASMAKRAREKLKISKRNINWTKIKEAETVVLGMKNELARTRAETAQRIAGLELELRTVLDVTNSRIQDMRRETSSAQESWKILFRRMLCE